MDPLPATTPVPTQTTQTAVTATNGASTTITTEKLPDTTIGGVSVRGWLVLMLSFFVCAISAYNQVFKNTNNVIEEPLYSGFMIALGYYFGQKK